MTSKLVEQAGGRIEIDVEIDGRDPVLQFKRLKLDGDARNVELGEVQPEGMSRSNIAHRPAPPGSPMNSMPWAYLLSIIVTVK